MTKKFMYEIKGFIRSRNVIYCFLSSLFFGLLSYLYFFTNNLNNYDNISVTPVGYGTGTSSGRWFLGEFGDWIGELWGNYNIPIFNGILTILILAVTSCIIVEIFKIKNKWLCILIGGITVVFPPIASAMFFSYTVGYYALAIFFVVLGTFLVKECKILGFIFGSLLFSFSLGTYQAYYPLCASIFILILIKMCIDSKTTWKEIIVTGFKFLFSLALGYILYKLFLKYYLYIDNIQLGSYKGIDQMGKIDVYSLPAKIKEIFNSMLQLTFDDYMSISATKIIQHSFLGLYIITFITLILLTIKNMLNKESILKFILLLMFIVLLFISINFVVVMVPNGYIYTIMQMGFVCIFYLVIILIDNLDKINLSTNKLVILDKFKLNKVLLVSTIVIVLTSILNYAWQTNGNYRLLYYNNRQLENYYQTLYTRIKSTEGYKQDMNIYFVGSDINDKTFSNFKWENTPFKYGGNGSPLNTYSRHSTIENYLGYSFAKIENDSEEYKKYQNDIEQMDKYPNDGSIKILDNNIFIRFE
ncbi:glucosyltransferase domain-containing protein [Romboutsia sedimentorum]|uniref:Glucosyltransferase domain-containing protein n=1 Tax=Romboutsia sedimentorum TaxID=1368474 RepID=A0ABT7E7N7_9FIRM|nr:glucosyltransferase domain-containing protein [Romboutsia sedimentorum]MDK2562933.1 glucosyltransferase domain-containing protein [Romboutsia sedimentorum]